MDAPADTTRFYAELPPLDQFEGFAVPDAYRSAPADWVVLTGDVRGSTAAIAAGRYKEVNMVGAAVIAVVLNACRGPELPFSFGGDGGAVLVPGSLAEAGAAALRRLQAHAGRVFGLGLRAAAVPVSRLLAEGHALRVGRLRLNERNALAMFAGSGMDRVDAILKGMENDPAILSPDDGGPPDLDGLSCRWEPLEAGRGRMIALMVRPTGGAGGGWDGILRGVTAILESLPAHAPATSSNMRLRWPPGGLWLEARAAGRGMRQAAALARATIGSALQNLAHRRGMRIGHYDAPRYLQEMTALTDFRRFDGSLRMVLDCTPGEVATLEGWLEGEYRAGRLVFGMHEDRAALMTCLVFGLGTGRHVHFVDAAGGGFTRAAEDFKRRVAVVEAGDPADQPGG